MAGINGCAWNALTNSGPIGKSCAAPDVGHALTLSRSTMPNALVRLFVITLLFVGAPAVQADQGPLRVTAIPDEAPTELIRNFAPLGDYLSRAIGRETRFVPVSDYAAAVEALAAGQVDLAWLGGFTFVQAQRRSDGAVQPLVQRIEDAQFRSVFIAGTDAGIDTLQDLTGRDLIFGSPSSTSGHLMPRLALNAAGIDVDQDLRLAFSGAHDATALAVAGGRVDAGALNASVWQALVDGGRIDTAQVDVFYTTPPFPDYNWSVAGDVDEATRSALSEAFLALDPADPEHAALLELQRASGYLPASPELYAPIEAAARAAGLFD